MSNPQKKKPRALDLFCGAGGASVGLYRAGFDVTGIDHRPQPRYPFRFILGDATRPAVNLKDFDFIWASPPCQGFSAMRTMHNARTHKNLIPHTRRMLTDSRALYCIENVHGAPLINPVMLCGTMMNLGAEDMELWRHRLFETRPVFDSRLECRHRTRPRVIGVYGDHFRDPGKARVPAGRRDARNRQPNFTTDAARAAMQISWMTGAELSQAIPPAYAEVIGRVMRKALKG